MDLEKFGEFDQALLKSVEQRKEKNLTTLLNHIELSNHL